MNIQIGKPPNQDGFDNPEFLNSALGHLEEARLHNQRLAYEKSKETINVNKEDDGTNFMVGFIIVFIILLFMKGCGV